MKLKFFPTPAAFRNWLAKNHATATELQVGYYKKHTEKPSITWPESVDQALCYGWIDGIRRRVDDSAYTIRFTPRKRGSIWSSVNIARAKALIAAGQMQPAGLTAFKAKKENKSGIYSYEQREVDLPGPYARLLKKNKAAWTFFQAQSPSYRKQLFWYVVSAKTEATRLKRLEAAMARWAERPTSPKRQRRA
jgi:uncharacterized protein YdeI (YjbR/CyaY-like superfamily)